MIREAIILAGGLGTRLRNAIPDDTPKCMAEVAGKPFISFIISYLQQQGIESFIFSLGYKHEVITTYLNKNFDTSSFIYMIETEPLGTGGAIKLAMDAALENDVLVLNGDTFFCIDVHKTAEFHLQHNALCTLALKPMYSFDRYGVVEINKENAIQSFLEKKYYEYGLINGGVYALNTSKFKELLLPDKFSFEKDFLEIYFSSHLMYGIIHDTYFIDIGIPEDLQKARTDLLKMYP